MVGSQFVNLIPDPFFGHNLCIICPNGSCKPTLDIYVPKGFQWYKELLGPISFDPCNHSLKIWESTMTPTPKMGVHLGVWVFILTLSCTPKSMRCDSRPSFLAPALTSPFFGCEPKARVANHSTPPKFCERGSRPQLLTVSLFSL
jgi:hypothetical protein